jgi:hypothetical protein
VGYRAGGGRDPLAKFSQMCKIHHDEFGKL